MKCPTCHVQSGPCVDELGLLCAPHSAWIAIALPIHDTRAGSTRYERRADAARSRRAINTAAGRCINHGDRGATHGSRCFDCFLTHRYGATAFVTNELRVDLLHWEIARV